MTRTAKGDPRGPLLVMIMKQLLVTILMSDGQVIPTAPIQLYPSTTRLAEVTVARILLANTFTAGYPLSGKRRTLRRPIYVGLKRTSTRHPLRLQLQHASSTTQKFLCNNVYARILYVTSNFPVAQFSFRD